MAKGIFSFGGKKAEDVLKPEGALKAASPQPAASKGSFRRPAFVVTATPASPKQDGAKANATLMASTGAASAPAAVAAATAALREDAAVTAWHAAPRVPSRLMDTHVNYLVLGETGLGKTSFIQSLTSSFKVASSPGPADGSSTSLEAFKADPASLRTVLEPLELAESSRRLMVTFQDAPGFGSDINLRAYLRTMVSFLLERQAMDYAKIAAARGVLDSAAMTGQLENAITAVLYLVAPHRIKKADIIILSALSRLVTVIPVIAKADAMTAQELTAYRAELMATFTQPPKEVGGQPGLPTLDVALFSFDGTSVLEDLGVEAGELPVAVVTGRNAPADASGAGAAAVPARAYSWGSVNPLRREHNSDLLLLKRLLLGDATSSLYLLLDDVFARASAFCCAYEDAGKQLAVLVQEACAAGDAHVAAADEYARARAALDGAKAQLAVLAEENQALAKRLAAADKERQRLLERLQQTGATKPLPCTA